jgi:hypothetical protein
LGAGFTGFGGRSILVREAEEIYLSQRGRGDLGDYKWLVEEKKDERFRSLWDGERRTPVNEEEEGYGAVS